MPTIVFFISSYNDINTGVGGHYRSIKEIANLLKNRFQVKVFTFGNIPSPILETLPFYEHVETGNIFSPATWKRLNSLKTKIDHQQDEPTLYVSVGDLSCYIPVLVCLGIPTGKAVAHVKPGGPSFPRSHFYNGIPMMTFHSQDLEAFRKCDASRPLFLAPGRVAPPPLDHDYLAKAVPALQDARGKRPRMLCVCRIAGEKLTSLRTIYGALSRVSADMHFAHIGIVQDTPVLQELQAIPMAFPSEILTASDVVDSAARAVHECDLFTGLGRSIVEAIALGKIAFVPVRDGNGTPRLVALTRENWRVLNHHNFTDRVSMAEIEATGQPVFLEEVVEDPSAYAYLGVDSQAIYDEHLSIATSESVWRRFFEEAVAFRSQRLRDCKRFALFVLQNIKRQLQARRT